MSRPLTRGLVYLGLAALYILHNDLWLWDDPRLLLGLPVGFTYHILFCVAVAALMLILVARAWPEDLEVDDGGEGGR